MSCQPSASAVGSAADPGGELDLDRVGVLELVEQQPLVVLVQRGADVRVAAQQVAREHEQVVELQLALTPPDLGGFQHPVRPASG